MTAQRLRATVRDLRRDNRSALLWSLFGGQPCTRQELAASTGLSPASVSTVIRELISQGIVAEAGPVASDGGRPHVLLQMNQSYGQVIGIDVGETRISAEAFDLTMTRLARAEHLLDPRQHSPDLVASRVASCLNLLLDDGRASVIGVGIGVPGAVRRVPGQLAVVHAQSYGWDAIPFEQLVRDRTGIDCPLLIDNGAKAMAQAELWFGAGRTTRRAAVCLIGSGVGASLVSDGVAADTEWGHTVIVAGGRECRCGARGCLEAYVGAEAILDRCGRTAADGDQEAAIARIIKSPAPEAADALAETAYYLGIGIASLINLVNPDRVIIGGWAGLMLAGRLMPAIRESARDHALRHTFDGTVIERGELGSDAVALGAATLPIDRFLDNAWRSGSRHG